MRRKVKQPANSGRKYKDSLIRMLASESAVAIEICNAISGTNYKSTANIKHFSVEDKLLGRYGDILCAIENKLFFLIEHMSTLNFNIPMRILQYVIDAIELIFLLNKNLHQSELVKIPTPKFYMLYNGRKIKKDFPKVMRLSDSFILPDNAPALEVIVEVIDIGYGSNSDALKKSPTLNGYAYLVHLIESRIKTGFTRDKAIATAINQCIKENVLAKFLEENYKGVVDMLGYEYTLQDEIDGRWLDGISEGKIEGRIEGRIEGKIEGRIEGRIEGKIDGKMEVAQKMLELGMELETIAKCVDKPISWVENLFSNKTLSIQ
ncbi:MAG: hypothetical protein FWG68_06950 [Defluviitaleaceae bacterium]|nr:hypothetical protein [Defluviitaleaceae bacterium]